MINLSTATINIDDGPVTSEAGTCLKYPLVPFFLSTSDLFWVEKDPW
jgi:hypothetical protein